MFKIETLVSNTIVAGKIKRKESFFISDEEGQPVTSKTHETHEAAQLELDNLGNYQEAMEFAIAMYPEQSTQAHKTKAAIVAEYLAYVAGGRVGKVVVTSEDDVTSLTKPIVEQEVEHETSDVTTEDTFEDTFEEDVKY